METKSQIKINTYENENINQYIETNMEKKSHRSKSTHMKIKSQIKINVNWNIINLNHSNQTWDLRLKKQKTHQL